MKHGTIGKAVLMAMSVCMHAFAADVSAAASKLNAEGVEFVRNGEIGKAMDSFKAAIDADAHCVEAARNLGKLLIAAKRYAVAEKLLDMTAKNNPDDVGTFVQSAQNAALMGKKAECETAVRRVAELDRTALPSLALLLSGQNTGDCAEFAARLAVERNPSDAEAWFDNGIVAQRAGRTSDAVAAYSKAVELKPDYADAWVNLGNMQDALGKTDEAIASYEKAHAADSANPLALYNLGRMLLLKGKNPAKGIDLLQEATRYGDDPGAAAARNLLLGLLSKNGKGGAK